MLSRDAEYPPLILDGDELYLKISLKGVLNSQMSSAQPSEKKKGSSWRGYVAQWD